MSAAVGPQQSDDVTPQLIVHTQHVQRSSDSMSSIHRHRPHAIRDNYGLSPAHTCSILVALCSMRHRSALPLRFRLHTTNFLLFMTLSVKLIFLSPFLPLNLVSRRGFSYLYRSGSGACSRARLLPPAFGGVTPVLGQWLLVQTVWLVDSTENALPTPSDAPLA